MAGNIVISTINGGAIGTNNVIINGAFGINQRAVSGTVVLSAGAYGHDRWKAGASGCTYTFSTTANITTLTISAGSLMQVVEGLNLQSGSYVMSWTGSAQGRINGGSYAGSGVTGTATGGTNLTVEFGTGTLSNVQLEAGSTASSFGFRSYGTELSLCQRYYSQVTYQQNSYVDTGKAYAGSGAMGFVVPLPVTMRSAPTCNTSGLSSLRVLDSTNSVGSGVSAVTMYSPSAQAYSFHITLVSSLLGAGQASTIDTASGSTFTLTATAEL